MSESVRKALFYHYLLAGLGLVLLAIIWAFGFFTAPSGLYDSPDKSGKLLLITALTLASWNLMSCVCSAGFFHAASKALADTYNAYKAVSLRLFFLGIVFVFPVPLMTSVLGSELFGRIYALFIIAISMATILFGRARINAIAKRLEEYESGEDSPQLAPFEESTATSEEL